MNEIGRIVKTPTQDGQWYLGKAKINQDSRPKNLNQKDEVQKKSWNLEYAKKKVFMSVSLNVYTWWPKEREKEKEKILAKANLI